MQWKGWKENTSRYLSPISLPRILPRCGRRCGEAGLRPSLCSGFKPRWGTGPDAGGACELTHWLELGATPPTATVATLAQNRARGLSRAHVLVGPDHWRLPIGPDLLTSMGLPRFTSEEDPLTPTHKHPFSSTEHGAPLATRGPCQRRDLAIQTGILVPRAPGICPSVCLRASSGSVHPTKPLSLVSAWQWAGAGRGEGERTAPRASGSLRTKPRAPTVLSALL